MAIELEPPPRSVNLFSAHWRDWLFNLYRCVLELGDLSNIIKDSYGVIKVSNDKSVFHGLFTFDIPPSMWIIQENGVEVQNSLSTKGTSVNGHLNITSGSTALDSCLIESRRHPRFQPNRGLKWSGSLGFKGANLDGVLKAGLITNSENGYFFKTIGNGKLYATILDDGIETHSEEIKLPFSIDITKGNYYQIQAQWGGVGDIVYLISNPKTSIPTEVHKIKFLNLLDEKTSIINPALSAGFEAENVTQEVSFWCGDVDITSEGGGIEREQYGESGASATVGAGQAVFALRNPNLAPNGKMNTRDLRLARVTVSVDKKSTFKLFQTRDPTSIVGGTFSSVRTGSFVESNTTMTSVNTSLMESVSTFRLLANDRIERENPSKETIDFFGVHGDYLVIVCMIGSNVAAEASVEWGEEI